MKAASTVSLMVELRAESKADQMAVRLAAY